MGILSNFTNLCRFRPDVGLWTKLRTFIKLAGGRRAEQEQKNYQVDVLFIFPPHARFFGHMAFTFPLGLGWLVSYLKERGISSMIYHMDYFKKDMRWRFMSILDHRIARCVTLWDDFNKHLEDPDDHLWNTLREFIRQTNPKIVGVTATAITLKSALVTARIAKEVNPNIKVVIGGPAATTQTEKVQANENVDFVVTGEGEKKMYNVARHVLYGDVLDLDVTPIANLDTLPFPDRESLFTMSDNFKIKQIWINENINGSRGCPFPCRFCATKSLWGNPRMRSTTNIIDEAEEIVKRYGKRSFDFGDDLFIFTKKRIMDFCKEWVERGICCKWTCCTRLTNLDEEMLTTMKAAGCTFLAVGIESGSDRVLQFLNKVLTVSIIREKTALINMAGLGWSALTMCGVPTETEEEVYMTLRLIEETQPTYVGLSVFSPYPGSDLYNDLAARNMLKTDKVSDIFFAENNYSAIPDDRYKAVMHRALAFADCYNVIHMEVRRHYFGNPVRDTLAYWFRVASSRVQGVARRIEMRTSFNDILHPR